MRSILLAENANTVRAVYAKDTLERLAQNVGLETDKVYSKKDILENPKSFADVTYMFSTWSMPFFSEEDVRAIFPGLKAVLYSAGSVQGVARPYINNGIEIHSAWAANAVPVAEVTVAEIILANKGYHMAARYCSTSAENRGKSIQYVVRTHGNYGCRVGIIGVGMIGALVADMLKNYRLEVVAFDPFCSEEKAKAHGVKLVSLEELFSTCEVISNHLANNAQTKGMLNYELFSKMNDHATFINTGRGAQVVEEDLIRALKECPMRTAILDVTEPEPPKAESEFYSLENVILTPHLAGSQNDEWHRMSEYMEEEVMKLVRGEPTKYNVTMEMLATMA